MAKFVDWIKKYKWHIIFIVLGIVIVLAIIACVVLGCLSEDLLDVDHKTLWISFLCAVAGAGASLLVGLIAFWQNKRMKQLADAKDALTKDENEKQRKQDLLIKTNPKAVFEKLNDISFIKEATVLIFDTDKINRLTEKPFNDHATFCKEVNMNLIFSVNENVDSICVTELQMSLVDETLWPVKSQTFINPSKTPYGQLKVVSRNRLKLYIQLLWDKIDNEDTEKDDEYPLNYLVYKNTIWSVTMKYNVGNDLSGQQKHYQTQFYFQNLSGDKNNYGFMSDALDEKSLKIKMIEDRTTTWIIKEETQNGQAEDDVDGQGE